MKKILLCIGLLFCLLLAVGCGEPPMYEEMALSPHPHMTAADIEIGMDADALKAQFEAAGRDTYISFEGNWAYFFRSADGLAVVVATEKENHTRIVKDISTFEARTTWAAKEDFEALRDQELTMSQIVQRVGLPSGSCQLSGMPSFLAFPMSDGTYCCVYLNRLSLGGEQTVYRVYTIEYGCDGSTGKAHTYF